MMMQVPGATKVSVAPLTVHTEELLLVNSTVRPELAVADKVDGVTPMVCAVGCVKVMVCVACATAKLCGTEVAAAYVLFPACEAVMVQVPTPTNVSVVPLTVQTVEVEEANCTLRPEVAEAESAAGVLPMVWLPGEAKVMLWVACATVKVCATGVAAL